MTDQEWKELDALRKAISYNPAAVVPKEQERFTRLFVETLKGKGDRGLHLKPQSYAKGS
jgi:hypothetical protein